jgi:hypothetical protein
MARSRGEGNRNRLSAPWVSHLAHPVSVQQLLSMEAPPSPLSSRPKRSAVERSLCGCSFLEMFFLQGVPGFLLRAAENVGCQEISRVWSFQPARAERWLHLPRPALGNAFRTRQSNDPSHRSDASLRRGRALHEDSAGKPSPLPRL